MTLTRNDLIRLARTGAQARLAELQAEIDAICRTFPDLRGRRPAASGLAAGHARAAKRPTGRRNWTPAQKKAAAERMRKYWAGRKAEQKKSDQKK